ncbi:MAG: hypothetical protein MZV63_37295 [Marinilabiliales bacterium]|nr:hypothetical protein [Marinilabiliales bacterium]
MPSVIATGRALWKIYGILNLLCHRSYPVHRSLLMGIGQPCACSSIQREDLPCIEGGILYYHSTVLELILIPIMIAGALPFKLYYLIVENRRWSLFGDEQVKLFFLFLAIGVRSPDL